MSGADSPFRRLVAALPYGKRLPTAVYVFRGGPLFEAAPPATIVRQLAQDRAIGDEFNVLKVRTDLPRLSFLSYPAFFEEAHPALETAHAIDLATGRSFITDYRNALNPPILHRKELLLPPGHESIPTFAALSAAEEEAGLYQDTSVIGFRQNWERLLAERGIVIDGHTLRRADLQTQVALSKTTNIDVQRHRTALTRYTLSKPVRTLVEYGQLPTGTTFFDYGCGLGADVRGLRELGFAADGWDPVHQPSADRKEADVVNLGYVLNVVEDPAERISTLLSAWKLARRLLAVSVLVKGAPEAGQGEAFRDGVITSRRTFQKYFSQQEAQQFLEDVLEHIAVPVALGVFYVFRSLSDHQAFLTARSRRHIDWESVRLGLGGPSPRVARPRTPRVDRYETNRELAEAFLARCLELGRVPLPSEFERTGEVSEAFGSPRRALAMVLRRGQASVFEAARTLRKNDLLVYLAIGNLQRRVSFSQLPESLREDIKEFFGNYSGGLATGLQLLHSAADPTTISLACEEAPVGWQDPDALYVHSAIADQLPPVLRAYVACAERLYGDARQADLVKLHKLSGKVSFLTYDSFDSCLLPELLLRAKVNLRTLWVEVFDHAGQGELLYYKERFLATDDSQRGRLVSLGECLRKLGIPDSAFLGPRLPQLMAMLNRGEAYDLVLRALSPGAREIVS